jgi:hypothetical protein
MAAAAGILLAQIPMALFGPLASNAHAAFFIPPIPNGHLLAGVGQGLINHYTPAGALVEQLNTTTGTSLDTGMCFDQSGNLYTTNWIAGSVSKFSPTGALLTKNWATGFNTRPESCVVDKNGNVYVGEVLSYQCTTDPYTLFDNWNTSAVGNNGKPPTFDTAGKPYCLSSISTYHWNFGNGKMPGTISLTGAEGTLGPWSAVGSVGQATTTYPNGVPNAGWTAAPGSQFVVINGKYTCNDSDAGSWSQNEVSGGYGFCRVRVETAVAKASVLRKFAPNGSLVATFALANSTISGVDFIDLAADQCTIFYTSESYAVKKFNVCTNTQPNDFYADFSGPCYTVRIRPNGEIMVACATQVYRMATNGATLKTYTASSLGELSQLYGMTLDPDGTSFWVAGSSSGNGNIYRVDIASGTRLTTITAAVGSSAVGGLAVVGEPRAALTGTLTGVAQCPGPAITGVLLTNMVILPGAKVELLSGSAVVATTTAGTDGSYTFTNLAPGVTYGLRYTSVPSESAPITCGVTVKTDLLGGAVVPAPPSFRDRKNDKWTRAYLVSAPDANGLVHDPFDASTDITDVLTVARQSRWFKFPIQPGGQVRIGLENLPDDYYLALFKDLAQINAALLATSGGLSSLKSLNASLGSLQSSPIDSSPLDSSPLDSSPLDSSPLDSSPLDSSPLDSSPLDSSPLDSSPLDSSPLDSSPLDSSPLDSSAYGAAQQRGLMAVSAHRGRSPQLIVRNTWSQTGNFYVRIFGRNGRFDPANAFTLKVKETNNLCAVALTKTGPTTVPTSTPHTLILTNSARLGIGPSDPFITRLRAFASRPEIGGQVVDLAADTGITANYTQWANNQSCSPAANVVADSIRDLITRYRTANPSANPPLEYIVLAGDDRVIPHQRIPDQAAISPERSFSPPVKDLSVSQASLRQNYFLSQDLYGTISPVSRFDHDLNLPDMGVGRLVETIPQMTAVLDAYEAVNGVVAPTSALATGYTFLADIANDTVNQLTAAGLSPVDGLIEPKTLGPANPAAWNADQLRQKLFGPTRYGIISLNAHFSASAALAADFSTLFRSTEVAGVTDQRFRNALVVSNGCHAGYNTVNGDATSITQPLDFPEAFAGQGATLIASTGYGYGDTDFIAYTSKLLSSLTTELRYGTGPVPIGKALTNAKRGYLTKGAVLSGTDEKAIGQLALYGLPFWSVNLPAANRLIRPGSGMVAVTPRVPGLGTSDVSPSYTLNPHNLTLRLLPQPLTGPTTVLNSYYDADGDVQAIPLRPVLGRKSVGVKASGPIPDPSGTSTVPVPRGAALISADYQDVTTTPGDPTNSPFRPYVNVPSTEAPSPHPPYVSSTFFPTQPFAFNALTSESLALLPSQYRSAGDRGGTARIYPRESVRVYYSNATNLAAALAGPLGISSVVLTSPNGLTVHVEVIVSGASAAGLEDVLATFTSSNQTSTLYSHWASCSLLPQRTGTAGTTTSCANATVSTLSSSSGAFVRRYGGDIPLVGSAPKDFQMIAQAVSGTGLVSVSTNNGSYYSAVPETATAAAPKLDTTLSLDVPASPITVPYRAAIPVSATFKDTYGTPLVGKEISFKLGNARALAITNGSGVAATNLVAKVEPGTYQIMAAFAEDASYLAPTAPPAFTQDVTVTPAATSFNLQTSPTVVYRGNALLGRLVSATSALGLRPITLTLNDGRAVSTQSDYYGSVRLDSTEFGGLTPGPYTITLGFGGEARYLATTSAAIPFRVTVDTSRGVAGAGSVPSTIPGGTATFGFTVKYLPPPKVTAAGAGTMVPGSYSVAYSYVTPLGESALSVAAPVTLGSNNQIQVAAINGIPWGVSALNFYFTSAAPGALTGFIVQQPVGFFTGTPAFLINQPGNGATVPATAPFGALAVVVQDSDGSIVAWFIAPDGISGMDWLAVSNNPSSPTNRAIFQGTGSFNWVPGKRFLVIADKLTSGDRFEVRVWDAGGSASQPNLLFAAGTVAPLPLEDNPFLGGIVFRQTY